MTNTERLLTGYHLVVETDVNDFNDIVNHLIEDGYQFMNNDGVQIENPDNELYYKIEMVRYAPDLRTVETGRPERRTMPEDIAREIANTNINRTIERMEQAREENQISVEEHRRRTQDVIMDAVQAVREREPFDDVEEETQADEPRTPPGANFWTADSPDPFDDDEGEEDDEVYNEHQLRRMGMAEEPQTNDEIMGAPQMVEEPQTNEEMPF